MVDVKAVEEKNTSLNIGDDPLGDADRLREKILGLTEKDGIVLEKLAEVNSIRDAQTEKADYAIHLVVRTSTSPLHCSPRVKA